MIALTILKPFWGGGVHSQHLSLSFKFFPILKGLFPGRAVSVNICGVEEGRLFLIVFSLNRRIAVTFGNLPRLFLAVRILNNPIIFYHMHVR